MNLRQIKPNLKNPRLIKDERFEKLKKSIREFPKMMKLRPIIVDYENTILAGNMRYKALIALGYTNIPNEWVKRADDLTDEEAKRFIIVDNLEFGEHDWEILANEWDDNELEDWGLEGFPFDLGGPEDKIDRDKQLEYCDKCGKRI